MWNVFGSTSGTRCTFPRPISLDWTLSPHVLIVTPLRREPERGSSGHRKCENKSTSVFRTVQMILLTRLRIPSHPPTPVTPFHLSPPVTPLTLTGVPMSPPRFILLPRQHPRSPGPQEYRGNPVRVPSSLTPTNLSVPTGPHFLR